MSEKNANTLPVKQPQKGLFVWTAAHLIQATQAVNGHWISQTNKPVESEASQQRPNAPDLDSLTATRIITDSRQLQAGDIFLAIVGPNFDGHTFLETAAQKGAVAAIVSQPQPNLAIPQLQVIDTRLAFGQIAAYRRQQHTNLKVIALTGSSGKTTVKDMLRCIFMAADQVEGNGKVEKRTQVDAASTSSVEPASTLITRGNLNNDFGVPMMLLELTDQHRYAVLELGANHVGEIAYTAAIVKPDVACILNIGTAHLGEFGGRDNIAKTKAEIYAALTQDGSAIVPFDDDYYEDLCAQASQFTAEVIRFGWLNEALAAQSVPKVFASQVQTGASASTFILHFDAQPDTNHTNTQRDADTTQLPLTLPLAGQHNVSNALAAAACAYALGISPSVIVAGLSQATSSKGRLGRQTLGKHLIIDDTYNANPNSVRAAADVLAAQTGSKILILGDIGELGDTALAEHTQLGAAIATKSIDTLLCVGEFAKATVNGAIKAGMQDAEAFATKDELLAKLLCLLQQKDSQNEACTLLFKGSRSATMETLIAALNQSLSPTVAD